VDGDGVIVDDETSVDAPAANQAGAQVQSTQQAKFSTYWEDPIQLDVNKVTSAVRAYTSGGAVTSADCRNRRYYLSTSGWYELSAAYGFSCDANSTRAQSVVNAAFQNDTFCAGNSTSAYYFGNTAYATPYGMSGWINSTYVYSGCTSMLSGPYYIYEPGVYW
jgi:hypothetical protein